MKYLLDIVVILIFLLCVAIGRKRGFIKTVAGVVALVVALAVSAMFNAPVAEYIYNKTIEPAILSTVSEKVEQIEGSAKEQVENVYEGLSPLVKNMLAQTGIESADDLALSLPLETDAPIPETVAALIYPVLLPLVKAICSLLLFLVAYIVASIVLRVLNVVAKLPILKQVNKTLGLIGGIVSGVLWVLVAVTVIQIIAAMGTADGAVTLQTVQDTLLVDWIADVNPLSSFIG